MAPVPAEARATTIRAPAAARASGPEPAEGPWDERADRTFAVQSLG